MFNLIETIFHVLNSCSFKSKIKLAVFTRTFVDLLLISEDVAVLNANVLITTPQKKTVCRSLDELKAQQKKAFAFRSSPKQTFTIHFLLPPHVEVVKCRC